MTYSGYIIYQTDTGHDIKQLCAQNIDFTKTNVMIPHIGETFIDKRNNIEYEVKDVIRSINEDWEYGIHIMLTQRTVKKYKQ